VEAHRVDARHDVVAQVGRLEAAGLERGNHLLHGDIDRYQPRGVVFALAQAQCKAAVREAVALLQEGAVGPAGKARRLFIDDAKRQQFGCLELGGVFRLRRSRRTLG
jgi:hypothetical protein